MNDIDPEAAVSDQVEAAAFARDRHVDEPGREGEGRDRGSPELDAFLEELHHGLPRSYGIDMDDKVILDADGYRVCGLMRVISFPRRPDGSGYAVEVEFLARDGRLHRATASQSEVTRGSFIVGLVDRGLASFIPAPQVARYLMAWDGRRYGWRADQAGWFKSPEGDVSFVRADGAVHDPDRNTAERVVLVGPQAKGGQAAGSLQEWQHEVAAQALGNPAMIFAISTALAGPLLRVAGIETMGINLFGPSATGKSLLLRLAISVAGDPASLTPWSAAETGLHRQSTEAQDGLLALDALPRDPGAKLLKAVLALGDDGGAGRVDAARDPDGSRRFRRIVLSASELPISALLQRKKKSPPSALALRMIDIPATQGRHGLLDNLHGHPDSLTFARTPGGCDAAPSRSPAASTSGSPRCQS